MLDLGAQRSERKPKVVSVGELVWDLFPCSAKLGGSPANVAYHCAALGAESALLSRVGDDPLGRQAKAFLKGQGVNVAEVELDRVYPTGQVQITWNGGEPEFVIAEQTAWDRLRLSKGAQILTQHADVMCFGTLAQRTATVRAEYQTELKRLRGRGNPWPSGTRRGERPLLLLDLNLREPYTDPSTVFSGLVLADAVKLNLQELNWIADFCPGHDPIDWLLRRFALRLIALTRGAEGASLYGHNVVAHAAGISTEGGDPVGAGDAFVASLAVSLARQTSLPRMLERANRYAAWVASQAGAMPSTR